MSGKVKVLFNSGLYTLSSLLIKAFGFLLLPVYTMFLTPEDYGITNMVNGFNSVVMFVVGFSLYSAVVRFYTDYKEDREKLKEFYGTIVIFVFLSGSIFTGLGFILQKLLISWFFKGIAFYPIIVIALIILTFDCLYNVHQCIMQGMQLGKKLTIRNLTVFGFQVGCTLLFIGVFKLGAVGVLLATLSMLICYFIYMIFDLKSNDLITFCINKSLLHKALRYSIPLMPHSLSTSIATFASRVFINNNWSLSSVGLYSVASQFGNIIDTVQASANQAFSPWFYDVMTHGDDNTGKEIVDLSRLLIILYSIFYIVIGLFSQEVIILMTDERYVMAWTAVPILVMAFSVKSIYYFYVNVLFYYKEAARKIFIATIIGSLADIILAYIIVPVYGMYGAAVAFLNAKIIVTTIVIVMSKRYKDIGYKVTEMLKIVIPSLLFMGAGLYFSYTKYMTVFSWGNLLYKFGVVGIYLGFLYFTNRKMINKIIKTGQYQIKKFFLTKGIFQ
ncbi:oligosaccharide flippase family protein [Pelotomaculum propionicicum]